MDAAVFQASNHHRPEAGRDEKRKGLREDCDWGCGFWERDTGLHGNREGGEWEVSALTTLPGLPISWDFVG